jgi:hypothetical protein
MAVGIPRHCFRPRYVAVAGLVSDEGVAQKTSSITIKDYGKHQRKN